ncbi:PTS transporter subunit EIIB [Paenibacillus polymyxa]|nr:PTS transporter subunit EIIB [Paenibacillus polymyxa]
MSHNELAKEIIQLIGGEKNVSGLTHCATRLRFNLKDNGRAYKETLKKLNGVLTVVEGGGQFQVVIELEMMWGNFVSMYTQTLL